MKKSRHTEKQIIEIMNEVETGTNVDEVCRKHGISRSSFYKWKSKYGGLDETELRRLKALEAENSQLKRMYADLSLKHEALKEIIEKKL
jgi:putative transposase